MRWGQMHWGIDLAAPLGTPIYAAADGVVLRAGPASGFGNAVYIQDADGNVHIYGHMRYYDVRAGDVVHAGDQIAKVGNQGQSTGPHLHYEIHRGGMRRPPDRPAGLARRARRRDQAPRSGAATEASPTTRWSRPCELPRGAGPERSSRHLAGRLSRSSGNACRGARRRPEAYSLTSGA